jgi:hypothetical protein
MSTTSSSAVSVAVDVKPAAFEIQAVIDGFPVNIRVEGKADALRAMIDRLKAIGAQPPAAMHEANGPAKTEKPVCPIHHTPMKPSRKPGSFFCPKRDDSGDFCDAKV